jgi:hypothetical protein
MSATVPQPHLLVSPGDTFRHEHFPAMAGRRQQLQPPAQGKG